MPETFAHVFAINGVWLYGPNNYQEEPVPVMGYNQLGQPVRQGYPSFVFIWDFMIQEHMSNLMAAYTPATPQKTVTFIDKNTGEAANFIGMMHEPIVGQRQIIYYANVSVKFTRCQMV